MTKAIAFLLLALILNFQICNSQNLNNPELQNGLLKIHTHDEYLEDFDEMVNLLVNNHPRPFDFTSQDSFQILIEEQRKKINDSLTLGEYHWICRSIVSNLGCGHTRISNPSIKTPDKVKFPIEVNFIKSRLYVTNPLSNYEKLKKGDEIISINEVSVSELRKQIFKHLPADGYNSSYKQAYLNRYFSTYCSYQFKFPKVFEIALKNGSSKIQLNQTNNFPPPKMSTKKCPDKSCFEQLSPKTGLMTISGFGYYGEDFEIFKSFIDNSFKTINTNNLENLIIDVRGNNGGDAFCASYLLQHLLKDNFTYFTENAAGYESLKTPIKPSPNRFNGNIFILINGDCFSTTTHFLAILKAHNLGTMVGLEAGGTYTCNDNSNTILLSNTGLSLRVARNIYEVDIKGKEMKNGILPHHIVHPEIIDLINENDWILSYTKNLIEQNEQGN